MARQYTKDIREDAVRYYVEHKELGLSLCSKNLGICKSTLGEWKNRSKDTNGEISTRGRGNFESDAAKENARLRKELRDTQDALYILKKAIGILGN